MQGGDKAGHWNAGAVIEQAGASFRFLPPYSSDFNPIEKALARLAAVRPWSIERLIVPIASSVEVVLTFVRSVEVADAADCSPKVIDCSGTNSPEMCLQF